MRNVHNRRRKHKKKQRKQIEKIDVTLKERI
jgi:hypothetical protein